MQYGKIKAAAALVLSACAVWAAPLLAQGATTALFDDLRQGMWEIRERGQDRGRRICLRSERDLVQLRHRGQSCRRIVTDDNATSATVQYSCPGTGYGRTNIRLETSDLVQLRSDGIERSSPFSVEAEGRRVGDCAR